MLRSVVLQLQLIMPAASPCSIPFSPAATRSSPCIHPHEPQCPNLRELDLSECRSLKDAVFDSLSSGAGPGGYLGQALSPGAGGTRV